MAVPDFQSLMLPLLRLAGDGQEHRLGEAVEQMAAEFQLSEEDQFQLLKSGQTRLYNRVGWATTYLKKAGLFRSEGPGRFVLTDRGRKVLATNPVTIDVAFLEQFPEMSEFRRRGASEGMDDEPPATFDTSGRTWALRTDIADRIQAKLERAIPSEVTRRLALDLLGFVIENADEERPNAWYLRESRRGVALMAGRLQACRVAGPAIELSVVGPIDEGIRSALGAEAREGEEWKSIPGGLELTFPAEHADEALRLLRDEINSFVDLAMARVRSAVSLDDHSPEAIEYVGRVLGRELPQPEPGTPVDDRDDADDSDADDPVQSREPKMRGRPPIFEPGQRSIASLLNDIDPSYAVIALPDLQRPFVWEDTKVRDLLDSLFLGFPVGTLVLWHTTTEKEARAIGVERPGLRATTLVIDGQQRLTSLYAVMRGEPVIGKDGSPRRIQIAFRPRDGRFEVADAANRNDPDFIPDVTVLWDGRHGSAQIRKALVNALRDSGRVVDEAYEDAVEHNIDRARAISDCRLPTVDIRRTAGNKDEDATEEDVAEIFVRINNQGTKLGQADFVLTLLSVFHGGLRDRIEERSRAMSTGTLVPVDTQQLLRAACAVAFGRARMSAVYRYLRGIDPVTGEADAAGRAKRLDELDRAADDCMDATPWRDFLLRVMHAGFASRGLITSRSAVINAFAFYVRGRRAGVAKHQLDDVIARWVFATLLTARYSRSPETIFEEDLARVSKLSPGDHLGFVHVLDEAMNATLSGDYWSRTLVGALETQNARAPAALGFRAAQVVLRTHALFGDQLLQNMLDPPAVGLRSASEAHHLFPEAWLHKMGVRDRRQINQVANLADVGWHENNMIGARGPADYVPRVREKLGIDDDRWGRMCAEHALPPGWEAMEYGAFLEERRQRMAEIVRVAFRKLGGEADAAPVTPPWFMPGAEEVWQKISETERALRRIVREVYAEAFGDQAAQKIQDELNERERDTLARALRNRPAGADPLSIVDYLYLAQLPAALFASAAWPHARQRLGNGPDLKRKLSDAVAQIAPVRNEIAHVREVERDRLLRASLSCNDILELVAGSVQGR